MAFIKAHLILLITGVATLAFVVLAVLGMMSDSVVKKMQERAALVGQLKSNKANARNEESIAAESNRVTRLGNEYKEVEQVAAEINAHTPLMEGIFPAPERAALAYDFRDAYRDAVARLARGKLAGGDVPTAAEIEDAKDEIAEINDRWKIEHAPGEATLPRVASQPGTVTPPPGGAAGPAGAPDLAKEAATRARIAKARNIRCYVGCDPASSSFSFSLSPLWGSLGEPQAEEMWYAQVSLWVEQDVVAAIAGLNDEAARRLKSEEVCVEDMPVKRVQSVSVLGYFTEKGLVPFPVLMRLGTAAQPTAVTDSFSGRRSNKDYDVVRFAVVAVVDQRAVTQLINVITKQNCYELIEAKCESIGPTAPDAREGYLYGTAPVVRATLNFEGYLARNVYSKWFPSDVKVALGLEAKSKDGKPGDKPKGKRP